MAYSSSALALPQTAAMSDSLHHRAVNLQLRANSGALRSAAHEAEQSHSVKVCIMLVNLQTGCWDSVVGIQLC